MTMNKIAKDVEVLHALAKLGLRYLLDEHDFTEEDLAEEIELVDRLDAMLH